MELTAWLVTEIVILNTDKGIWIQTHFKQAFIISGQKWPTDRNYEYIHRGHFGENRDWWVLILTCSSSSKCSESRWNLISIVSLYFCCSWSGACIFTVFQWCFQAQGNVHVYLHLLHCLQSIWQWCHALPYAIFQQYAKHYNKGQSIGLIHAADTQMGGHVIIAMLCFLCLQAALWNTVTSVEFFDLSNVSSVLFVWLILQIWLTIDCMSSFYR